ncbi:ABC transporter substrate-binding protein [Roseomonas gilardii subsp. gilardii]|uniref:ABC transporter substrate-binding protein n=1 Tax=Roseomonas gilardii TaxID=257708 RepID=UPI001FFAF1D9|nr:ABC transporter substrate-binding protein [Roseomonas gilardii]UPG73257.1 ABC transporter substrate-binding protein [Roseomonas gilardii subsp. gilardii]
MLARPFLFLAPVLMAGAILAPHPARAQPAEAPLLRIGLAAEPSAADPHHYALTPNSTLRAHLFDALTDVDAALKVVPGLATRWERTDDRSWVFHLRPGVTFSNGESFGAPDVVFSFCRILNNKDELVSSFSQIVRRLESVEAKGEDTLLIRTRVPEPLLLSDLSALAVIPRSLGRKEGVRFDGGTACGGEAQGPWPTQAAFNSGSAAIGTGPYRLATYARGEAIVLRRNEHYWGPKPHWAEIRMTPITQAGPRMAALLAGDQDLIESPATADLPRLRREARFAIAAAPTTRLIFLQLDTARDPSPFVEGRNALRDPRVRQALSLAIDRKALQERIMDGGATPATQFLPDGMLGTIPGLPVLPYDPAKAKALLAEAGYPDGVSLTLHATNNRYINDARLAQAIVQQWQRIGVKAELDAIPAVSFFARRGKRDFSVAMGGWSTDAGETLNFFRSWLISTDAAKGLGTSNYGGWSDPAFDHDVGAALLEMDEGRRATLLQQAGRRALAEMPVIPLHFESAVWAMRKGLRYPGRVDQTTLATEVEETR